MIGSVQNVAVNVLHPYMCGGNFWEGWNPKPFRGGQKLLAEIG